MNIPSNKDDQSEPSKRTKVYNLDCINCDSNLCWRGIPAPVLTEKRTRLFSSDSPLMESVDMVPGSETMDRCSCRLQNIACLQCGNVVGYHVKRPCRKCLVKCKNKHLWVFYPESVTAMERFDFKNSDTRGTPKDLKQSVSPQNLCIETSRNYFEKALVLFFK